MDKTDRNVPPSIHEALITRHFARDPLTRETIQDPILAEAQEAMQIARQSAEKARRVAEAIMANEMATIPARHRQIRTESWRAVEGALRRLDGARERARREVETLEKATSAPPRPHDAGSAIIASEVRSRLAAMKSTARRSAIDAALRDGDDFVLGAVLNAPAMLSGLDSREEHDVLRARWRQTRHGAEVDRVARLGRALDDLTRGGELVISFTNRLSSAEVVAKAEASERAVTEAIQG